ncbi:MAG: hypothetical protein ACRC78_10305 [Planktothrix sp.]
MRSWSTFQKQNSWNNLQNKPAIFADNQIHWSEIQGIPERINFLATNIPGNWQPWVLSDHYSQKIEWLPLTASPGGWTMVQRNESGSVIATNFRATAIPTSPTGLSAGFLWKDTANSNVIKIV